MEAHSVVMSAASIYWYNVLKTMNQENNEEYFDEDHLKLIQNNIILGVERLPEGIRIILSENVIFEYFRHAIQFMYTGEIIS